VPERKRPERGAIYTPEYQLFLVELRSARERAGITQEELAQRLNKSQGFVTKAETGDRRLDIAQLVLICRALGISLPDFIERYDAALRSHLQQTDKKSANKKHTPPKARRK
jgi:transcriptional regulator with XRE-family HTH domain